jgi:membrane-associated phospholipid phosphatase
MPTRARKALGGAAFGVCLLAVAWYAAFHVSFVEHADRSISNGFAGLHRPRIDQITNFIADLCNPRPYVFLAAIPVVIALIRRRPRVAVTVGLIMLGANMTTQVLKPLLAAPRWFPSQSSYVWISPASWPSGHATAAMSLALSAVIVVSPRLRPAVGAAMATFAVAVCYSFLELGWHYPTDVLGGFIVASIWTLLGAAALWTLEARYPSRRRELSETGRPQFSFGEAIAPALVLILGAVALAAVVALARPHQVVAYVTAHTLFIVGAVAIGMLGLTLAIAAALALRRS